MKPPRIIRARLTEPAWLAQARRTTAGHWQRLAPREKRLVLLAAAVALLALAWLALLEPALHTTDRLRTALPRLRAEAAQVDVVLQEARALQRRAGAGAPPPEKMLTALQDSLARAGLGEVATASPLAAQQWQVALANAPIEPVLQWLQGLPFELRLQPVEASLARPAGEDGKLLSGVVTGTLALAAAQAQQP